MKIKKELFFMRDANKNAELAKIIRKNYGLPEDMIACFLQGYEDSRVPFPILRLICKDLGEDYVFETLSEYDKAEYLLELDEDPGLRTNERYTEVILRDKSFDNYGYQKGDIFPVDKTKKELNGLMAVEIEGCIMLAWTQNFDELSAIKFEFANKNYPSFYWPKIYMDKINVIGTVVLYTEEAIVF